MNLVHRHAAARQSLRTLGAAGLVLAALAAGPARAQSIETVQAENHTLRLPIPGGYCKFTRQSPLEIELIRMQEVAQSGKNRVLLMFGDCRQLEKIRARSLARIANYGMYLSPLNGGKMMTVPPNVTRASALREIAASLPALDMARVERDSGARAAGMGVNMEKPIIGLLETDANAVYAGMGATYTDQASGFKGRINGVIVMTVLQGAVVTQNLYEPAGPGAPFQGMLKAQKENARLLIEANAVK